MNLLPPWHCSGISSALQGSVFVSLGDTACICIAVAISFSQTHSYPSVPVAVAPTINNFLQFPASPAAVLLILLSILKAHTILSSFITSFKKHFFIVLLHFIEETSS